MDKKILDDVIQYLEVTAEIDPQQKPHTIGECFYCGAALDLGERHRGECHLVDGIKLLISLRWMRARA